MPTTRILSIALLSLLPALTPAFEWTDECDQNQLSMNTCAAQELQFHDQRLNTLYQQQMQYLEDPVTRERLRNAQRPTPNAPGLSSVTPTAATRSASGKTPAASGRCYRTTA